MKKFLGAALAAGAAVTGSVVTADNANAAVTYNVGVATDYVFRGIDQFANYGYAQAFGGADWASESGQFYLGTWISNTSTGGFGTQNVEVDLYGGWKPVVGPFTLDLGVLGYLYTDNDGTAGVDETDASNIELKAAASVPLGGATLGAKVFWTPDFAGDLDLMENDGWYYEVNAAYTFTNTATVSAAIGEVKVDDYAIDSYVTGNIGVTYPVMDHLAIDGRVIMNDDDSVFFGGASAQDTKVVGTLTVTF